MRFDRMVEWPGPRWRIGGALAGLFAFAHLSAGVSQSETQAVFFDDFTASVLDSAKWLVVEKNWGGQVAGADYNGGVVRENVQIRDGRLLLFAAGNRYEGPLRGINRDGTRRADGKRVGAAVATRDYFGSGRYEARMRIIPRLGVVSAIWTYHYEEVPGGKTINHEIDIEVPGRFGPDAGPSFEFAVMSAWQGEGDHEHITHYAPLRQSVRDNAFHVHRFDWYAGSTREQPRVEFYIDGKLQTTIAHDVPSLRGRFYIGAWFPRGWAGEPDFDIEAIEVDWVRITPLAGMNDVARSETYPSAGLRSP
jgi:beta-glucanase (GH16 family)